jgi:hypothetical protein
LVAWLFWLVLGWMGAHRFYLEKPGTGLLMMLTGGGILVWWVVDAFGIGKAVEDYNREQARRERAGDPPLELDFMPHRTVDVEHEPPEWTREWARRGSAWRAMRFAGDLIVLMAAGASLGAVADVNGGTEAAFGVTALIVMTLLGGQAEWLNHVPLARALIRWNHRLRLFYYFNRPAAPPVLLVRPVLAFVLAPFRRRDRAETRLYLELGAAFTLFFMAADLVGNVVTPMASTGLAALAPLRLAGVWFQEVFLTFFFTYAFASPIGAVLALYLLTRPTHTVPRILGAFTSSCCPAGSSEEHQHTHQEPDGGHDQPEPLRIDLLDRATRDPAAGDGARHEGQGSRPNGE